MGSCNTIPVALLSELVCRVYSFFPLHNISGVHPVPILIQFSLPEQDGPTDSCPSEAGALSPSDLLVCFLVLPGRSRSKQLLLLLAAGSSKAVPFLYSFVAPGNGRFCIQTRCHQSVSICQTIACPPKVCRHTSCLLSKHWLPEGQTQMTTEGTKKETCLKQG